MNDNGEASRPARVIGCLTYTNLREYYLVVYETADVVSRFIEKGLSVVALAEGRWAWRADDCPEVHRVRIGLRRWHLVDLPTEPHGVVWYLAKLSSGLISGEPFGTAQLVVGELSASDLALRIREGGLTPTSDH